MSASESSLGSNHHCTFKTKRSLAKLLHTTGRERDAETLLRGVLAGQESRRDALFVVNDLAKVLQTKGEHQEAEELLRSAVEGYESIAGPVPPDPLSSLDNLANLLSSTNRSAEAEPL